MSLRFTKMHGLGNDFIVVDATEQDLTFTPDTIRELADRHTGIGFDQMLQLQSSQDKQYDYVYRIFNADGQEVEQCGNGARCVAHYIFEEKLPEKSAITLSTLAGKIELKKENDGQITVNMGTPDFNPEKLPFITDRPQLQYQLPILGNIVHFWAVSVGNPHVVICVNDVDTAPVQEIGAALQSHPAFPNQVNVGFMEIVSKNQIRLRVYERGAGETRSCGTGACAAVVVGRTGHGLQPEVKVDLRGGQLRVKWPGPGEDVYLTGPAQMVFKGELLDGNINIAS